MEYRNTLLPMLAIIFASMMEHTTAQQGGIISPVQLFINSPRRSRVTVSRVTARSRNTAPTAPRPPIGSRRCTRRQRRRGRCQTSRSPPANQTKVAVTTRLPNNIQDIRREINTFIEEDHEMIPNLLQLVFHSCVGGCDGCINPNEPANIGLKETYKTIRKFWSPRASIITLADMIVLMASEAIEIGMDKEGGPGKVNVAFRTGRLTCNDPDNYTQNFVFPHGDNTSDVEHLQEEFGLTRRLAIALLGSHSVGRCHKENSGFAGRWDNTELTLDNHYYKSLVGTDWRSTEISGKHQWNATRGSNSRMMLNSDLALLKNFTINDNNRASCVNSRRCENSSDADQVKIYARDNDQWAEDFIQAYLQMVNMGL